MFESIRKTWTEQQTLTGMAIWMAQQPALVGTSEQDMHYVEPGQLACWLSATDANHKLLHPRALAAAIYFCTAWDLVDGVVRVTTCRLFGHHWVSEDYATPDSGYMGCSCDRCGLSEGTQLY